MPKIQSEAVKRNQAIWAASSNDVWTLRRLYEAGFDLNLGDYDHRTPLHVAVAESHHEATQFLLKQGVDLNPVDRWGQTPLDEAVRKKDSILQDILSAQGGKTSGTDDLDEKLIEHVNQTNITALGDPDLTAELIWSASLGELINLQRLHALGYPLELRDYDGRTPLHLAAAEGHDHVCQFLITHGHSTDVVDRWGFAPADDAKRSGFTSIL